MQGIQPVDGVDPLSAHDVQIYVATQKLHGDIGLGGNVVDGIDPVGTDAQRETGQAACKLGTGRACGDENIISGPDEIHRLGGNGLFQVGIDV